MKYSEFVDWCNERACDGQWGRKDFVITCVSTMDKIRPTWFWWRREQKWKELPERSQIEKTIEIIEEKRRVYNNN
jgi:hypothetical protein